MIRHRQHYHLILFSFGSLVYCNFDCCQTWHTLAFIHIADDNEIYVWWQIIISHHRTPTKKTISRDMGKTYKLTLSLNWTTGYWQDSFEKVVFCWNMGFLFYLQKSQNDNNSIKETNLFMCPTSDSWIKTKMMIKERRRWRETAKGWQKHMWH